MESVKKRKRAVAYVRVSSGSDAQIHSFEFQSAYWHNELDSNPDVEMVGIYADKGISGRSMYKRPQFLTMMQDAREGKFDVIYTKSISRFGRNTVHLLESVRELRDLGIAVIFQNENINTLPQCVLCNPSLQGEAGGQDAQGDSCSGEQNSRQRKG